MPDFSCNSSACSIVMGTTAAPEWLCSVFRRIDMSVPINDHELDLTVVVGCSVALVWLCRRTFGYFDNRGRGGNRLGHDFLDLRTA